MQRADGFASGDRQTNLALGRMLKDGVDLINTDDLSGCRNFLRRKVLSKNQLHGVDKPFDLRWQSAPTTAAFNGRMLGN